MAADTFRNNNAPATALALDAMRAAVLARFDGDPNYYDLVADRDKGMGDELSVQGPLYTIQDHLAIIDAANFSNLHLDDADFDDDNPYELSRILSYTPTFPAAANECRSAGWGFSADGPGSCGVPLTLSGRGRLPSNAIYTRSSRMIRRCAPRFSGPL